MSFITLSESHPKARKVHICDWCGKTIEIGERYFRYSGICDGDMQSVGVHLECEKAMERDRDDSGDFNWGFWPHENERGKTPHESEEAAWMREDD